MILSYNSLLKVVQNGIISAPVSQVKDYIEEYDPVRDIEYQVNGASIDVRLSPELMVEDCTASYDRVLDPLEPFNPDRPHPSFLKHTILPHGYVLAAKEFVLGATVEQFKLPNTLAAEFKLKSSLARYGLSHCLATWANPGWSGVLILELYNVRRLWSILLRSNMLIGQMIFHEVEEVPDHVSYRTKGRYNEDLTVTASRGVAS
jgi:deoxycytidine triphosphate deaminase